MVGYSSHIQARAPSNEKGTGAVQTTRGVRQVISDKAAWRARLGAPDLDIEGQSDSCHESYGSNHPHWGARNSIKEPQPGVCSA